MGLCHRSRGDDDLGALGRLVEGRASRTGMNSFSHYAIGSVGEWMYRTIVGINPDEAARATSTSSSVRGRRRADLGARRVSFAARTHRLRVEARGRTADDRHHDPANTSATVHVPTSDPASVPRVAGPCQGRGRDVLGVEDGAAKYNVAAGHYTFEHPGRRHQRRR